MNIFALSDCPIEAAKMVCDKHLPKMIVESAQMMASALRFHGATDKDMPLTLHGTPYKGGYPHHPCTRWTQENKANFLWLARHAFTLAQQFDYRYGHKHACLWPLTHMASMADEYLPEGDRTPFAQAMPEEYKDEDAVKAYREYYHTKTFAKWVGPRKTPSWWRGVEVIE
ncbi:MAG: hypothetical protein Tp1100DCM51572_64 [Prokaryotic dsDNA virus sp.]|nr:MAG: hypothetical protein Tp1100DCM51572_64 [Prokaryotic dsDNA virus sp.]|tara:strand:- start:31052 stop:31561 length:510 start_codon:yes stop_codon:yes gene_type:complete